MLDFFIGFLIICVILAVPSLRNAALFLIGLVVVVVLILVMKTERENAPPPPPDPKQLAREAKARECIANQLPSLEVKLQAFEHSITEDTKFESAISSIKEILGSEPATERAKQNILDRVIISTLRPSCDTSFDFLINVVADEQGNLKWLKIWAENAPAGYNYKSLIRDFDELRSKKVEQARTEEKIRAEREAMVQREAKEAATRSCVANQTRLIEGKISKLISQVNPSMTFWEAKALIDKSLNVASETKDEGNATGERLAYSTIKPKCDTPLNYLFNLAGDGVGRLKWLRFWLQEPGKEYSPLNKFNREYAVIRRSEEEQAAREKILITDKNIKCDGISENWCGGKHGTVTIYNGSTLTLQSVDLGWVFFGPDEHIRCPSVLPPKIRLTTQLPPLQGTAINFDLGISEFTLAEGSNRFTYCLGIAALGFQP